MKANTHDFPDKELGKAVPYGVYDMAANAGWVAVGSDGDTAQFTVETIRRWWNHTGKPAYPNATQLLISADAGGSNGYRLRLWKTELAKLADETGLSITVCHMPPGTSKWNKIEHRLGGLTRRLANEYHARPPVTSAAGPDRPPTRQPRPRHPLPPEATAHPSLPTHRPHQVTEPAHATHRATP